MEEPRHILRYPTAEAIEKLADRFGFPTRPDMQDWAWEVADSNRIDEFLAAYETGGLSDDERFTLMEVILESFEEIGRGGIDLSADARWRRTMAALERNISLHAHSVWYWSCPEAEGLEEVFHISRFIRQIMAAHRALFAERVATPKGSSTEHDSAWPFSDPKNVAVFTVSDVMHGRLPILRVCHDEEDGAWQFLTGGPLPSQEEWMLVALEEVVKVDPTVLDLARLPCGWHATRTALGGKWTSERRANE